MHLLPPVHSSSVPSRSGWYSGVPGSGASAGSGARSRGRPSLPTSAPVATRARTSPPPDCSHTRAMAVNQKGAHSDSALVQVVAAARRVPSSTTAAPGPTARSSGASGTATSVPTVGGVPLPRAAGTHPATWSSTASASATIRRREIRDMATVLVPQPPGRFKTFAPSCDLRPAWTCFRRRVP